MRPRLLERTVQTNLHMDHKHTTTLWSHMDGCDWENSARNINGIYSSQVDTNNFLENFHSDTWGVTGLFHPDEPRPSDAAAVFGYALHPIQDLYSHSNWVEIFEGWADSRHPPGTDLSSGQPWNPRNDTPAPLIDSTLDIFRARAWVPRPIAPGFIAARHPDASGASIVLVDEDGYNDEWVTSDVVNENPLNIPYISESFGEAHYIGVISGYTAGSFAQEEECPSEIFQSHTNLNKDGTKMTVRYHGTGTEDHYAAAEFATRQTAHEWCRLLHLAKRVHGFAGVSVPMGFWVRPDAPASGSGSPHPPGTACETTSPGGFEVTVDVRNIRVLNDTDSEGPGELNFVLVLYTQDLTRSVRAEVNSLSVDSGNLVDFALPGPLTLCLTEGQSKSAIVTVQAWDDDAGALGELNPDGDQALRGVYAEVTADGPTSRTVSSPDMVVTFVFQHSAGADVDGDGLSACAEAAIGTDPADSNTDGDSQPDGSDNCPILVN